VTEKFDKLIADLMKENMMAVNVLGQASSEPYDISDVRTPKVMGMRRRLKIRKKKSK
jgi:hypothetical protein